MSINVSIPTKKEINDSIKLEIRKLQKDFYCQLNKLRAGIIDLNDIIRVLKRSNEQQN